MSKGKMEATVTASATVANLVADTKAEDAQAIGNAVEQLDLGHAKLRNLKKNFEPGSASDIVCDEILAHMQNAALQFVP